MLPVHAINYRKLLPTFPNGSAFFLKKRTKQLFVHFGQNSTGRFAYFRSQPASIRGTSQDLAYLLRKSHKREGFADQRDTWVEPTAMDDSIARVA
jgi:hypothetical protein